MGVLSVKVCYKDECKVEKLVGQRAMKGYPKRFKFDKLELDVEYGSKVLPLPFSLKLRKRGDHDPVLMILKKNDHSSGPGVRKFLQTGI